MNFLANPLALGFVWRIGLLLFAWITFWALSRDGANHDWWIRVLQAFRIVPVPQPAEEVPLYTRTNVLVIGPAEPKKQEEPEPVDYTPVLEKSRVVLKVLGVAMILVTLVHGFQFYRLYDPYFLFGPQASRFSGPADHPKLPPAIPGAGGAGALVPATTAAPRPAAAPAAGGVSNPAAGANPSPGTGSAPAGASPFGPAPAGAPGLPPQGGNGLPPPGGGGGAIPMGAPSGPR